MFIIVALDIHATAANNIIYLHDKTYASLLTVSYARHFGWIGNTAVAKKTISSLRKIVTFLSNISLYFCCGILQKNIFDRVSWLFYIIVLNKVAIAFSFFKI